MWGADIWNLYGTEGLVKRTPTVTRQQRRRARQQVDMVSDHKVALPHVTWAMWNSDQMTIEKAHPTLKYLILMQLFCRINSQILVLISQWKYQNVKEISFNKIKDSFH